MAYFAFSFVTSTLGLLRISAARDVHKRPGHEVGAALLVQGRRRCGNGLSGKSGRLQCRGFPDFTWRLVRSLRGVLANARSISRQCFPRLTNHRSRRECCSRTKFGPSGNRYCFEHLPYGPFYELCCGPGRRSTLRPSRLVLPESGVAAFLVPWPRDRSCFHDPSGAPCIASIITYHKTGNALCRRFLPWFSRMLVGSQAEGCSHRRFFAGAWTNRPLSLDEEHENHKVPFLGVPVLSADLWESSSSTLADAVSELRHPALVHLFEYIPIAASAVRQRPRSPWRIRREPHHISRIPPFPLVSYPCRVVHFVRRPATLIASSFRWGMRSVMQTSRNFAAFHALGCGGCGPREWDYIFSRCNYECGYVELLRTVFNTSVREALELEYVRSFANVRNMVLNLKGWANHSNVLHMAPGMFVENGVR
eukprot:TRINITY_DN25072_c0_g1_i1.p1 TRINITY_DN25072_c0_g1~~TRINITY_DN25072_c0_g1_i1.p1  ORF type:complete len:422 (+),score=18.40 TRINITY_DN25072_c0_g1_i1:46-1311(+)